MPIYEYECKKCSYRFELRKGFNESTEANCPRCQSEAQRIFSPLPIIFKGSGFYVTDNAQKGNKEPGNKRDGDKPASTDKSTEVAKEKKEEGKEEAK